MPSPSPRKRGHRLPQMPHGAEGLAPSAALGNEHHAEHLPEHGLLIAVLWQAVTDAMRPCQHTGEARVFLRDAERLAWFCEPLGLDAEWLQQGLRRRWPGIWGKRESED